MHMISRHDFYTLDLDVCTFDCNPEESSCLLLLWKNELVVVITEWVVSMARFFQVSSLGYEQAGRIARTQLTF